MLAVCTINKNVCVQAILLIFKILRMQNNEQVDFCHDAENEGRIALILIRLV